MRQNHASFVGVVAARTSRRIGWMMGSMVRDSGFSTSRLRVFLVIAMSALLVLSDGRVNAQACFPQLARITAVGETSAGQFGFSTALSSDGSTALVGAAYDDSGAGTAYVYVRSGIAWSQQARLVTTTGIGLGRMGWSASLSADGNTAVVGAPYDNSGTGAAYVFVRSGTSWSQQGSKLVPSGGSGAGQFGYSVALSADGNTLAVGAVFDNTDVGAVYFFIRSGGVWSQQNAKMTPSGGGLHVELGVSVALSSDGNTAAAGAAVDGSGAVYVYTRTAGVWTQQGPKLVATGGVGSGNFGWSVSLSSDGNTFISGGKEDNGGVGAAYIFSRTGTSWSQEGSKLAPIGGVGAGKFGVAVSLAGDGNTALVGAFLDNGGIGASYFFVRSGGLWTQRGVKLVPSGGIGSPQQIGSAVALSADGTTAAIGAIQDNAAIGATYLFGVNSPVTISQHPAPSSVLPTTTAAFMVAANSNTPLSYQWRRNGVNLANAPTGTGSVITGADTPTLTISYASYADNGSAFDCVVSNSCGSKLSDPAGLAVGPHCRPDFNANGTIEVADIFAFLSAWFAGCP